MKLKVCGMKYEDNVQELLEIRPDFIGFIFYRASRRYVSLSELAFMKAFESEDTKTVGVFVNHDLKELIRIQKTLRLNYVQLHGSETPSYAKSVSSMGIAIIKAFQIDSNFNWSTVKPFADYVDYFLFDTKSQNYGGSGEKFDWSHLDNYSESVPFFLSGGIQLNDDKLIKEIDHPFLEGIDINSGFESNPGQKIIISIEKFQKKILEC